MLIKKKRLSVLRKWVYFTKTQNILVFFLCKWKEALRTVDLALRLNSLNSNKIYLSKNFTKFLPPWNKEYPHRRNRLCVGITVSSHTKGLEKIKLKKHISFQYAATGPTNQTYNRIITRIFTNLYIFANLQII